MCKAPLERKNPLWAAFELGESGLCRQYLIELLSDVKDDVLRNRCPLTGTYYLKYIVEDLSCAKEQKSNRYLTESCQIFTTEYKELLDSVGKILQVLAKSLLQED